MKRWKEIIFIFSVVAIAFTFNGYRIEAEETATKVKKFEETFDKIAQIADDLKNPNIWLRNYLVNHGVDSVVAKSWSNIPRGPVMTKSDTTVNIPYLEADVLPDIGVQKVRKSNGATKIMDTLWNFSKKAK